MTWEIPSFKGKGVIINIGAELEPGFHDTGVASAKLTAIQLGLESSAV